MSDPIDHVPSGVPNNERARHWCFTLNNYTDEHENTAKTAFDSGRVKFLIYGKEIGASGTPHLQGFVSFGKAVRRSKAIVDLFQAHFTVARNIGASVEYCKKDGAYTEFGVSPVVAKPTGKRKELPLFMADVESGVYDLAKLRKTHPNVLARYPRFCLQYVLDHKAPIEIEDHPLFDWQQQLVEILSGTPENGVVLFYIDEVGGVGKSWFCSYAERFFAQKKKLQVMKCGKRDDMAFELRDNNDIIIIDVAKSAAEFLSYQLLEDIKDGRVFSPKYESYTKRFPPPHLVVFMNTEPDMTALTDRRYSIRYI
ncbi:MAG: putative viral replication protein [Cressdnaviricota sp.]|nr:MAG: putative viral replication protein [Cressdnaviricota sp.]